MVVEAGDLPKVVDEQRSIWIEGLLGTLDRQAWDGRVLVSLATVEQEQEFTYPFANLGANAASWPGSGVQLDSVKFHCQTHVVVTGSSIKDIC